LGVRWVEFDVKLSACGEPVLMHDDTVDRTTNGRGRVADMALAELRRLDAGAWLGPEFVGEPVPTLGEALAIAAELGLGVNVEIKPSPGQAAETARAVAEALAAAWPGDRPTPLVSSFSVEALAAAHDAAPDLPRGLLFGRPPAGWRALADELRCATLNAGHRHLNQRRVGQLKAADLPLLAYTVNDAARARDLFGWGVDAVFTDVPEVMSEWL
ncbi:MAG TPA: glycerophosphodiester phosphodiesterase family protein, partial [Geminicoccaceae bacterium]|nr:glycerophosphodiester phosphodiesterase family protein [Geminicoccaceae bacterium]